MVDPSLLTATDQFVLRGALETNTLLKQLVAQRPELAGVLAGSLQVTGRIGRNAVHEVAERQAHAGSPLIPSHPHPPFADKEEQL